MGQITTPTGEIIFVPDGLGLAVPAPPPVYTDAPAPPVGGEPSIPSVVKGLTPEAFYNPSLAPAAPPPTPMQAQGMTTPPPAPPPSEVQLPAQSQAQIKAKQKAYRADQKAQAQAAAHNASPEGQIANATAGGVRQLEQSAQAAEAQGDVAAREADEAKRLLDDRNIELQRKRGDAERMAAERERGMAERRAQYEKAVDAEANYKVDDGRRWRNMGTGSKILAGISVALAGIGDAMAGKVGTPNIALGIIKEAIREDVDAQVRDRDQLGKVADRRRNSLDIYRQETGDMREAANLKIAEEYKRAADQMESVAQKYANPKAKLAALQNAATLRLQAQQLVGTSAEGRINRDMQRGQLKVAQGQLGLGFARLKQDQKQFDKNLEYRDKELLLQAAQLDAAGNAAGAKAAREEAAQSRALGLPIPPRARVDGDGKPIIDPKTGKPVIDHGVAMQADGSQYLAPTEKEAQETRKEYAATLNTVEILDKIRALVKETGGEAFPSEAARKLEGLKQELVLARKAGTQGMSSDSDLARLESSMGVKDLTGWRSFLDNTAILDQAREAAVRRYHNSMRGTGFTGELPTFDDLVRNTDVEATPEEKAAEALLKNPSIEDAQRSYGSSLPEQIRQSPLGGYAALGEHFKRGEITPENRQTLDTLGRQLLGKDKALADAARKVLEHTAKEAQSDGVRAAARQLITDSVTQGIFSGGTP